MSGATLRMTTAGALPTGEGLGVAELSGDIGIEGAEAAAAAATGPAFLAALRQVWDEPDARRFTLFVFISMLSYSAQDLILEPFAGSLFAFTPGQSTKLSGVQHGGVFVGVLLLGCGGAPTFIRPDGSFGYPTDDEILATMRDMRAHDIDMITIGQYLQPSAGHLPVLRYVHPDQFAAFEREAYALGFRHAAVGALVRSSYHADKQAEDVLAE